MRAHLILVHNLYLAYFASRRHLLAYYKVKVSELSVGRCTHHKPSCPLLGCKQLALRSLAVGYNHLAPEDCRCRVVPEALHLQHKPPVQIIILGLDDIQLRTAFYSHRILLAALCELALKIGYLVLLVKGLQFKVDAFLLHLYLLLLKVALVPFPQFALIVDGAHKLGIVQDKNSVAPTEHCAVFAHNALHKSALYSIELYCHYRLDYSFDLDKFHKRLFVHCGYAQTLLLYVAAVRREHKYHCVDERGSNGCACNNVHKVLSVPGARR